MSDSSSASGSRQDVLVTGANGFVGGRTCRALAAAGAEVRALVRRPGEAAILQAEDIAEVGGDFTDRHTASGAVAGVDAVVHAAAVAGGDLQEARRVNRDGTRTIARAALDAGVDRFVHISTGAVYDRSGDDRISEDTRRVTEGSPYAVTKAEAEREVEAARVDGLPAVILRPVAVLGWGPTSTWGQRVPASIRDGTLPMRRGRDATYAYVHVDDVADAVIAALRNRAAVGRAYDVVADHTTWGRYVEDVRSWFPDAPPVDYADESPTYEYEGRRLTDELRVRPSRTYEDGMAEAREHLAG